MIPNEIGIRSFASVTSIIDSAQYNNSSKIEFAVRTDIQKPTNTGFKCHVLFYCIVAFNIYWP